MDVEAASTSDAALAPKASSVEGRAAPPSEHDDAITQALTPYAAVREMQPVLQRLGHHIMRRPLLFARVCRLCFSALQHAAEDDPIRSWIDTSLDCALLPANSMTQANPGLVRELWRVLELLPYTSRYRAYGALSTRLKEDTSPELTLVRPTGRCHSHDHGMPRSSS